MQKNIILILSVLVVLTAIPGIALNDVFAEKLIVADGGENSAQFSAIDKTTGLESQLFSDGSLMCFLVE